MKAEVKRLSGKLSYQGKSLKRRIAKQMNLVERAKDTERQAKRDWLRAQLAIIAAEDELNLLCAVSLAASTAPKDRKDG